MSISLSSRRRKMLKENSDTNGIELRIGMDTSVGAKGPKANRLSSRPLALLLLLAAGLPLAAQSARQVTLPHHVVKALSNATRLPRTPQMDQDPIAFTVVLNLSDEAGRDALAQDQDDPASPNYHTIISLSEFTARFGPTQQAYDSVLAYLEQNGFALETG